MSKITQLLGNEARIPIQLFRISELAPVITFYTHTLHTMYTDTRHMHTLHTVYIDTTHTPTHRSFWHPQFTEHKGPHRSWAYELEEGILALKPLVALGITASLWEWGVLLGLSK